MAVPSARPTAVCTMPRPVPLSSWLSHLSFPTCRNTNVVAAELFTKVYGLDQIKLSNKGVVLASTTQCPDVGEVVRVCKPL